MRRRVAALALALSVVACSPSQRAETPRSTLVIGLDISGSFRRNASFSGAIEFASLYIYGHLNGVGGLQPNTAILVGELGGVRLWTQDSEVMKGWRRHMVDGAPMQRQDSLWSWVDKVVDVRVRRERVL